MGGRRSPRRANEDDHLLAELYDTHSRDLLAFFQSRTYSGAVAADLVAETFATAVGRWHRFDPSRGEPGAWLWGIARNQLRAFHRMEAVESKFRRRLAFRAAIVHDDDLAVLDERIDAQERAREITAMLDDLSPPLAQAVTARVLEGLPYDEVARRCGCSVNAARVRVSRAVAEISSRQKVVPDVEAT